MVISFNSNNLSWINTTSAMQSISTVTKIINLSDCDSNKKKRVRDIAGLSVSVSSLVKGLLIIESAYDW